jgi:hypothetical protein
LNDAEGTLTVFLLYRKEPVPEEKDDESEEE